MKEAKKMGPKQFSCEQLGCHSFDGPSEGQHTLVRPYTELFSELISNDEPTIWPAKNYSDKQQRWPKKSGKWPLMMIGWPEPEGEHFRML